MSRETFRILKVLMWKHCVVRRRRFIMTTLELLLSLAFFLLIFLLRNYLIGPKSKMKTEMNIQYTDPYPLYKEDYSKFDLLIFCPNTNQTRELMDKVGAKLELSRVTSENPQEFYDEKLSERVYTAFPNEKEVEDFIQYQMRKEASATESRADRSTIINYAAIVFHNLNENTTKMPEELKYTIRLKGDFKTNVYRPSDDFITPHYAFGDDYRLFLRVQWAVDSSFLNLSGADVPISTVELQEFPFSSTMLNEQKMIVAAILTPICFLSLSVPFAMLVTRLLQERASGVQELIKMVGVSENLQSISHFLNALPTGFVYSLGGAMFLTIGNNPWIAYTNFMFVFIALLLHYVTITFLAFASSYVTSSAEYATTVASLMYLIFYVPVRLMAMAPSHMNPFLRALTGLLFPHMPFQWFACELSYLEVYGKSLTFSKMWKQQNHLYGQSAPVAAAYGMMCVQMLFFAFLTWYLSKVRPGKFVKALPYNFLCKSSYWRKSKRVIPDDEITMTEYEDPLYFEPPPTDQEAGIRIHNVTKVYGNQVVLNNVTLDVFKGEITVLLGHNGAGKTTLMNIITGLEEATEGSVNVIGMDPTKQRDTLRKKIGLCPQHNLFFPNVTVREHIMFFSMIKGASYKEAREESDDLLESMNMPEKAKNQCNQLSGGMKRRLQLACALTGDSTVLILDEPTSGLDVETRRGLWDLLLSLRGARTVLLTTHFMEEADALGDRVAALHLGRLKAHASPLHLKKNTGSGYRLSLTTIGAPKEAAITNLIHSHVPDAVIKEKTLNAISYSLPSASSGAFPRLFADLEDKRSELGISSIGVGVSTLEEVFLKICSDVDTSMDFDDMPGTVASAPEFEVKGLKLIRNQIIILMTRHFQYTLNNWKNFLAWQFILPLLLILLFTWPVSDKSQKQDKGNKRLTMDLNMYEDISDPKMLMDVDRPEDTIALRASSGVHTEILVDNITEAILQVSLADVVDYGNYIGGVQINGSNARVFYTTTVRHAAAVALNMLSNLLGAPSGLYITTYNYPIPLSVSAYAEVAEPKSEVDMAIWVVMMGFIILGTVTNAVNLMTKERQEGTRHVHVMTGCQPSVIWVAALVVHTTLYIVVLVIPIVVIAAILEDRGTANQGDFLLTVFVTSLFGITSFLAFAYLISFFVGQRVIGLVVFVFFAGFGAVPAILRFVKFGVKPVTGLWMVVILIPMVFVPPYSLLSGLIHAGYYAAKNARCKATAAVCVPGAVFSSDELTTCCRDGKVGFYSSFAGDSPLFDIIILILQTVAYMILVIATQHGVVNAILSKAVSKSRYNPKQKPSNDPMVRAEAVYVSQAIALSASSMRDAVLVDALHKRYCRFRSYVDAVAGVSFSVKKGECFGLLGVNGAGKSTTFAMITGETCPTRGRVAASQHRLQYPRKPYLKSLAYCPQFFGQDDFLTGRQNLRLLLTLRGLAKDKIEDEVVAWIKVVGLEKYADRKVSGYSGGCKRRLAAAAALSQNASVTLLDEPTAGVDVSARRKVWGALRKGLARGQSVIITSHSMDEMESLCNRIGIMVGGTLAALDSPAGLRANYRAGQTVRIKLRSAHGDQSDRNRYVVQLKSHMHQTFNCTLRDEHRTMLHYRINETVRYSELFTALEALKAQFPELVEDYAATETTLEEVFLSFAHPQGESPTSTETDNP